MNRGLGPTLYYSMPSFVGLTDRDDGTVWYLSHRVDDQRFSITTATAAPKHMLGARVYAANDGPLVSWKKGGPLLRLLVRGGRIGYELVAPVRGIKDIDPAPITTRRGNGPLIMAVKQLTWQKEGDVIGYEVMRE